MKVIKNETPFAFSLRDRGHLYAFLDLLLEETKGDAYSMRVEYDEEENNFLLDICGAGFRDLSCVEAVGENCNDLLTELMCLASSADQYHESSRDRFGIRIPQSFLVADIQGNTVGRL